MKPFFLTSVLLAALAGATISCQNTGTGAAAGAGMGAIAGAVLGNNIDGMSSGGGAIAGAVLGGVMGGASGNQQRQINEAQASAAAANTYVVNVRNSNGSTTPVTLVRSAQGWQGPRGELYADLPSEDQLRKAYGF